MIPSRCHGRREEKYEGVMESWSTFPCEVVNAKGRKLSSDRAIQMLPSDGKIAIVIYNIFVQSVNTSLLTTCNYPSLNPGRNGCQNHFFACKYFVVNNHTNTPVPPSATIHLTPHQPHLLQGEIAAGFGNASKTSTLIVPRDAEDDLAHVCPGSFPYDSEDE